MAVRRETSSTPPAIHTRISFNERISLIRHLSGKSPVNSALRAWRAHLFLHSALLNLEIGPEEERRTNLVEKASALKLRSWW